MPMWCPPTPPTSDNDVYVDYSLGFLYETTPMSEAQLPPVYVKKEPKRSRVETSSNDRDNRRPIKRHKEESVFAPRSLFDRPSAALLKMRRDMKLHKHRGIIRPSITMSGVKPTSVMKPTLEQDQHVLDWIVHEDWALLQAIQVYQGLPLNLVILSPGHTPNWDLVADIVNNTSRIYRSPKQCRARYETVIVPREEGKLLYDTTPKKQKKQKGVYKLPQVAEQQSKSNRPMRTCQLYYQDKNNSFTLMCCQRFDTIKSVSNKRSPTVKPLLVNPLMKNPKHAAVLAECGIQYDSPLTPIDVATRRAERIAKEKLKNVVNTVLTPEQQQAAAARLLQQQQAAAAAAAAAQLQQQQAQQSQVQSQQPQTQQIHITQSPQQQQLQQSQVAIGTATQSQQHQLTQIITSATTASIASVKTTPTNTMAPSAQTVVTTTLKPRQGATLPIQDVRPGSTIVNVANLQAAQRIAASANLSSVAQGQTGVAQKGVVGVTVATASGTKTLTQGQLQYYRAQQYLRQQQLKVSQSLAGASSQKGSVAVAVGTPQQRAALMKQGVGAASTITQTAMGKQAVARTVSESEMAALIKRQAALQHAKTLAQVQVPGQAGLNPAQIFAQAGLHVQQAGTSTGGTPVTTLVKTAGMVGVRPATPQQIRQLALHPQILAQRKLPGQKVAQLAQMTNKAGVQTQLIVQQSKSIPTTMTVQQIQQVIKHVQPSTMQQFAHVSTGQGVTQPGQVVLSKSPLQTRVIPVTVSSAALKQTIQVVTASTAQLRQATTQGKPIVTTARASPGPSQLRLQNVSQIHQPQSQQQPQQQQANQQDPLSK